MMNTTINYCIKCDEIPGLFTNEEMECEDICGDGLKITKQCDDGNTFSGDGCSNNCQVEYGFECLTPNTSCREIIAPSYKISSISAKNLVWVEFSEGITVETDKSISTENIVVEIVIGETIFTDFTWRIIEDASNPLVPNRTFNKFALVLNDIKTSLDGSEYVRVSFKDTTLIKDLSNNTVVPNSSAEANPYPFTYISLSDANTAGGGGASLKYTFMSVFSFNIGLKIIMNSSMQYLWGLVHAL